MSDKYNPNGKWSPEFEWSGGDNPVPNCWVQCNFAGFDGQEWRSEHPEHSESSDWHRWKPDSDGGPSIITYRVLLDSIPWNKTLDLETGLLTDKTTNAPFKLGGLQFPGGDRVRN